MSTVWKFPLAFPTLPDEGVSMPYGAKVLHVGMQDSRVTLWALVEPDRRPEIRRFVTVGTGHPIPAPTGSHVGSVMDGPFVWHIFEAS